MGSRQGWAFDTIQGYPVREVTDGDAETLAGVWSRRCDLAAAGEAFGRLQRHLEDGTKDLLLETCLYTTGAIRYRRCFATGVRSGSASELLTSLHPDLQEAHELLMNVANKHLAHSVNHFEEVKVGILLTSVDPAQARVLEAVPIGKALASHNPRQLQRFGRLIEALLEQFDAWSNRLRLAVASQVRKLDVSELLERPEPSFKAIDDQSANRRRT